jgi:DNA-binding response OmpR family regulator
VARALRDGRRRVRGVRGGRILVVDDDESVRVTLVAVLASEGYRVESAANGAEAIAIAESSEFDLLLTDLCLDDIDGLQVLVEVHRRWPDCVSILLTGYASVDSAITALRNGAYDYLCKPCPAADLLATVARGLERRQLAHEAKVYFRQLEVSIETARELCSGLESRLEQATTSLRERDRETAAFCRTLAGHVTAIASLANAVHQRFQVTPRVADAASGAWESSISEPYLSQITSEAEIVTHMLKSAIERAQASALCTPAPQSDHAVAGFVDRLALDAHLPEHQYAPDRHAVA